MTIKKIIAQILTVALLISLSVPFIASAAFVAPQVGDDVISNGGFEQVSSATNGPTGWTDMYYSWGTEDMRLETSRVHTGRYSVKMGGTRTRTVSQTCDLISGATYTLSFWVYNESNSSGVRAIYALNNDYSISHHTKNVTAKGEWTYYEYEIGVPYASTSASISFYRIGSVGYSYIDDVKLTIKSLPAKYRLDRRDIFNYSDAGTGEAYVYASPALIEASEINATSVEFSVMDGNYIAVPKKTVRFINNKATYSYDLSRLTEKKKYTLKAVVKYNGSTTEYTGSIYKYPRPTSLRSDGVLIDENNQPFVPLIANCPGDTYDSFAKLPEAGFNTAYLQVHNLEMTLQYLEWCNQAGLKAMVEFNYSTTHFPSDFPETTTSIVEAIKDDPAVLAYVTRDEPPIDTQELEDKLFASYLLFRNLDDVHPVNICQWNQEGVKNPFEVTAKYCDILSEDRYPGFTGDYPSEVSIHARKAMDSAGNKPVWIAVQSTSLNGPDGAFPTCDNMREHMYRALEEGAKGISYYSVCEWGYPEYAYLYNKPVWNDLKTFAPNEQRLVLDYFGYGKYETFKKVDEGSPRGFYLDSFYVGDDIYLIAHNRSASAISRSFDLISNDGEKAVGAYKAWKCVNGIPTENVIHSDSSNFSVSLNSQEAAFYKITPLEAINFEGLNAGVKTGWAGASIVNDDFQSSGSYELYLNNATVVNSNRQGAEGDNSYLKFETSNSGDTNNSAVTFRSRVTPGNNYVITFWSKTQDQHTLYVSTEYEIFQDSSLMPWTTDDLHESEDCYETYSENNKLYLSNYLYNSAVPVETEYQHEGFLNYQIGYQGANDGWVKNQVEIHVPHCADVVKFTVKANGRNTNAFKGAVDNFSIEKTDTNIICNGDFDYQAYIAQSGFDSATSLEGRLTPSGWESEVPYQGSGVIQRTLDNGNNYYTVDSVSYSAGQGYQIGQYVTLHPGTYKLSYRRNNMSGQSSDTPWGFVSMRLPMYNNVVAKRYDNEPVEDAPNIGALEPGQSGFCTVPVYGCSLYPHVVGNQKNGDGWVNHEVYFEVTHSGMYYLVFGNKNKEYGKFAIDDVVLLPVEDMELSIVKDGQVTSEEAEFTWTGQPEATTHIIDVKSDYYSSVDDGGDFQAVLSMKADESSKSGVLIAAVYKNLENGLKAFYKVDTEDFSVPANGFSLINTDPVTVPSGGDYTLKAFVMESYTNIINPQINNVVIE